MNIICYDIDGNLLKTLTQWDINQQIVIKNLSLTNTPEVHFCNSNSELALVGESTYTDGTLTTEVPNILLQESLPIIIYIYVPKGDGSAKTTYSIRIPVNPRVKPADYEYSDNAQFITYQELQEALEKADHANETAALAEASMEYGKSNFANAIKGTAHARYGEYIYVDDVSPIEHEMEVSLTQKNLITDFTRLSTPLTYENGVISYGEIADGYFDIVLEPQLQVGDEYVLSFDTNSFTGTIGLTVAGKYAMLDPDCRIEIPFTITEKEFSRGTILIDDYSRTSTNLQLSNIQIERGNTATEYAPHVDLTTVKLKTCGKNLFDGEWESGYINTDTGENSSLSPSIRTVNYIPVKPNTTYYFSFIDNGNYYPYSYDKNYKFVSYKGLKKSSFCLTTGEKEYYFRLAQYGNLTPPQKVQIEIGSSATEYEEFKGITEYTPTTDGTVENVISVYPTTVMLTDTINTSIECKYNKDTNKVIESLVNAIISLGGNV